jgi:hypothetical protein
VSQPGANGEWEFESGARTLAKSALRSGDIEEKVIQTKIISAEEQSNRDEDPSDAFDYMAAIPIDERTQYIVYIYRTLPVNGGGYICKVEPPIDEEYLRTSFGGGTYKLMVKRGSELKRRATVTVVGEPLAPGAAPVRIASDMRSEVVQIIQELQKNNPQGQSAEILRTSFINALEIQKAAAAASIQNNQPMKMHEIIAMFKDMHAMNAPAAAASENIFTKDLWPALIPIVVGLISKMVTPTDPLQSITQMSSLITAARQLGDGGVPAKEDLGNVIVKNLPGLFSSGSQFLAELRAATAQKEAFEKNRTIPVVVQANPALHTPPAPTAVPVVQPVPTPAAASVNAAVEQGAPTPQYILGQVKKMIERGETAGFVLDYLDENLPQIIDNMRMATPEQLRAVIASDVILGSVVNHEKFEAFFADFVKLLHEKPADAPVAPIVQ